jgi:hypothetical protein
LITFSYRFLLILAPSTKNLLINGKYQKRDARLPIILKRSAGSLNGTDFAVQNFLKLTFAYAVAKVENLLRFAPSVETKSLIYKFNFSFTILIQLQCHCNNCTGFELKL